jgi:hypothetical protein
MSDPFQIGTLARLQRTTIDLDNTPHSTVPVGIAHTHPNEGLMSQIPFGVTRRPHRMSQLLRALDHIIPALHGAHIGYVARPQAPDA